MQAKIQFAIKDLEFIVEIQSKQKLKLNAATIGLESDVRGSPAEVGASYFKTEFSMDPRTGAFNFHYAWFKLRKHCHEKVEIRMFLLG